MIGTLDEDMTRVPLSVSHVEQAWRVRPVAVLADRPDYACYRYCCSCSGSSRGTRRPSGVERCEIR